MDRKDCFGSIKEVTVDIGQTAIHTRPQCRNCKEIRDCLRTSKQMGEERKERDELRKQNMISQMIDLSHITSNEIGSCLLEFLSRIFYSPLGTVLFRNLLLFCEVPQNSSSFNLSIPISRTMMDLIAGGKVEGSDSRNLSGVKPQAGIEQGFTLWIVLLQRSFPNRPEANMGMIAYEVAHTFSSDPLATNQVFKMLSDAEVNLYKKMNVEARTRWLIEKWDFADDFEAFKKELASIKET